MASSVIFEERVEIPYFRSLAEFRRGPCPTISPRAAESTTSAGGSRLTCPRKICSFTVPSRPR